MSVDNLRVFRAGPTWLATSNLAASLAALQGLTGLQVLRLPYQYKCSVHFRSAAWDALAGLTGLTRMQLAYDADTMAEALQLTKLQPLEKLQDLDVIAWSSSAEWSHPWKFQVNCKCQVSAFWQGRSQLIIDFCSKPCCRCQSSSCK